MSEFSLIDTIPVGLFMISRDFRVVFWNSCFEDWTGIGRDSVLGKDIRTVFPRLREPRYHTRLEKLFEDGMPVVLSYQLNGDLFSSISRDHPDRIHHSTVTLVSGENGPLVLFAVEDRTEVAMRTKVARVELLMRYEVEKDLRAALDEKTVLMNELNHRVKNNLNMVRSLIALEIDSVQDAHSRDVFQDLDVRITSIALLHEMLYKTEIAEGISLDGYLESLCRTIFATFLAGEKGMTLDLHLAPVRVSTDVTLHVGLIVSELMTNSIKYGMKDRSEGAISIVLGAGSDVISLEVADDGPGFPADFDAGKTDSLGMKLVYMITRQMKGTFELCAGPGSRIRISIPLPASRTKP